MGIDYNLAKHVKENAPNKAFRVATLGRLNYHLTIRESKMLLPECGHVPSYRDYCEGFFSRLGGSVSSFDICSHENADHILDLSLPIDSKFHGEFDMVVDGGTLEHVYDAPQAMRNVLSMLKVGGVFIASSPVNGNAGHGFYQLSPEFWRSSFSFPGGNSLEKLLVYTLGKKSPHRLPLTSCARTEWLSLRPQVLIVVARKMDKSYRVPQCQSDYGLWIKTGVNVGYRKPAAFKRWILERFPFLCHWIEGWWLAATKTL